MREAGKGKTVAIHHTPFLGRQSSISLTGNARPETSDPSPNNSSTNTEKYNQKCGNLRPPLHNQLLEPSKRRLIV